MAEIERNQAQTLESNNIPSLSQDHWLAI